jgi:Laminin B (Domain IV)
MLLGFDASPEPTVDVWNSYAIGLDEAAGWRVVSVLSESAFADFAELRAPTPDEMNAVLANLTRLLIRGEFQNGEDTGYLDNVRFGATE